MSPPIRILVVDDTALYRKIVSDVLRSLPGVEVVGTAFNGQVALERIQELRPDLVTLDLEMPQMGGVEVLQHLRASGSSTGVVMLSAFTSEGAAATTEALRLGAFDFVLKPSGYNPVANMEVLRQRLSSCIAAFAHSRGLYLPKNSQDEAPPRLDIPVVSTPAPHNIPETFELPGEAPQVIVLGISTGGPEALARLIPALPGDLATPLFIVQHMPPLFTKSLADDLNKRSQLHVYEAVDGRLAQPGECIIAPGGRQMKIERTDAGPVVRISDDPPENSCRPAADYLFRSAAHHYRGQVLGVIMTGMGSDGALGCRLLKRHGATILAQNKESCVVFGMPSAVIEQGLASAVLPLSEMAAQITAIAGQGVRA
jgi:two-component system chemotaxis response regulator CheB